MKFAKICPEIEAQYVGLSSRDVIARVFRYHRTCYRSIAVEGDSATTSRKNADLNKEEKIAIKIWWIMCKTL